MAPRYVLIPRFVELTGYTLEAVRKKIKNGVWLQGEVVRRAPDGHIMVDLQAFEKWVEGPGARRINTKELEDGN